jgi:EpsD family peptidyl-prolyl cis-trans isomerase
MWRPWLQLPVLGSLLLSCAACDRGKQSEPLAASGDGFEVTIAELDQALRAMPAVPKDQVVARRNQVLNQLVDEKLLATAAKDRKLDREPAVMQQLQSAERATLAVAYASALGSDLAKPSEAQLAQFYEANPQRYSGRKVLRVQLIGVPSAALQKPAVTSAFKSKNMGAVTAALAAAGTPATPQVRGMRTDVPPLSDDRRFAGLAPGDTIRFASEGMEYLAVVATVTPDPVPFDANQVQADVMMRQRADVIRREAERLRGLHKVTYNRTLLNRPSMRVDTLARN